MHKKVGGTRQPFPHERETHEQSLDFPGDKNKSIIDSDGNQIYFIFSGIPLLCLESGGLSLIIIDTVVTDG